ncbi:MAG: M20/M25/M40 family metallo-hydrolase [Bacteroidales bacterium]|nr:M20/M25/M40 family metallo-hydrolase [Bacteroidales bacterium]
MDIASFRYYFLVFLVLSGYPLFGQDLEERPIPDHSAEAVFLSHYIQIPSITGKEKPAGEFLANACRENGLHVRLFSGETNSYNFAASLYPLETGKPNIVFLTHIDVVPEGDIDLWTYPPFAGVIADGHIWGRGAFDNKGHGVMQLFAIASFVEEAAMREFQYNFTLLAVSNEEDDGLLGAGLVAEHFLLELNPVVVYGEGGIGCTEIVSAAPELIMFGVEVAQKRALWLKMETSGTNFGHGSVPSHEYPAKELALATNVILNMKSKPVMTPLVLNMLKEMGYYEKGIRKFALKNYRFLSPVIGKKVCQEELVNSLLNNTITLTGVGSSSGAFNQMSNSAWATFDVRLLPGASSEEFLRILQISIKEYDVELIVIKETPHSPVSDTGPYYHALQQAIHEIFGHVPVTPMLMPATNDNLFFRAKGIPAYGLVPAAFDPEHVKSIHNVNERIPLAALDQGIAVYQALIRTLSASLFADD